jgi:hypothetical protein
LSHIREEGLTGEGLPTAMVVSHWGVVSGRPENGSRSLAVRSASNGELMRCSGGAGRPRRWPEAPGGMARQWGFLTAGVDIRSMWNPTRGGGGLLAGGTLLLEKRRHSWRGAIEQRHRWGARRGEKLTLGFYWALKEDKGGSIAVHVGRPKPGALIGTRRWQQLTESDPHTHSRRLACWGFCPVGVGPV